MIVSNTAIVAAQRLRMRRWHVVAHAKQYCGGTSWGPSACVTGRVCVSVSATFAETPEAARQRRVAFHTSSQRGVMPPNRHGCRGRSAHGRTLQFQR